MFWGPKEKKFILKMACQFKGSVYPNYKNNIFSHLPVVSNKSEIFGFIYPSFERSKISANNEIQWR